MSTVLAVFSLGKAFWLGNGAVLGPVVIEDNVGGDKQQRQPVAAVVSVIACRVKRA